MGSLRSCKRVDGAVVTGSTLRRGGHGAGDIRTTLRVAAIAAATTTTATARTVALCRRALPGTLLLAEIARADRRLRKLHAALLHGITQTRHGVLHEFGHGLVLAYEAGIDGTVVDIQLDMQPTQFRRVQLQFGRRLTVQAGSPCSVARPRRQTWAACEPAPA